MRVAHIASEALPYSKTGGLADVAVALPVAQLEHGMDTALITPWYGPLSRLPDTVSGVEMLGQVVVDAPHPGITAQVAACDREGLRRLFVCRPEYFDREHVYGPPGEEYFDARERYIFFARAALAAALRFLQPDVIHCHDWQTGLIPALLRHRAMRSLPQRLPFTVMTIHNLAFQGRCTPSQFRLTGLPPQALSMHEGEFHGSFLLLKAGIAAANAVTTVSPGYAREILTPEFGCDLDGFLLACQHKLRGIINGVDQQAWNPAHDQHLSHHFRPGSLSGKRAERDALLRDLGLARVADRGMVAGMVGRFSYQKGADMVADALPMLLERGVRLVILGSGDQDLEQRFRTLAASYPGQLSATLAYDEPLAHRIIAASDLFLMPSRFEPCGLTQLYAMRYGTLPVTTRVGGLLDTVCPYPENGATGFHMAGIDAPSLVAAVDQALEARSLPNGLSAMQKRAMAQDFSWAGPAREYKALYEELLLG